VHIYLDSIFYPGVGSSILMYATALLGAVG